MSKFMFTASYSQSGVKGVLKEGGSARQKALSEMVAANGGQLEAFYFMFGERDVVLIVELPDNATAAAFALTVSASGAASVSTTVLLTPEDIDLAAQAKVDYRPPGS